MPEQLTKYPEVTLEVLRSAGAQCGENRIQAILRKCPADRFCKLPGGELCVYGLPDAPRMTQIAPADWQTLAGVPPTGMSEPGRLPGGDVVISGGIGLLAGAAIGIAVSHYWRRSQ